MTDETREGLGAALAAIGACDPPGSDAEQGEFFDDVEPKMLTSSNVGAGRACVGRPPGSRNRRTEEWVRYLQSRYSSPLVGLAEIWSRSPADLARELELFERVSDEGGCGIVTDSSGTPVLAGDALERAMRMQMTAMKEALPYGHQKQAIAVAHKGEARGLLTLHLGGFDVPDDGGLALKEVNKNQDVIESDVVPSHVSASHDVAKK